MASAERFGKWRRSEGLRGWLMVSPTALYALAFLAVPLVAIVALSFVSQTGVVTYDYTPTWKNYIEAFVEPQYRALILRSVIISLAVTALTVLTAFPVAYFISFHVTPSRKSLWLFLITIPFWTSYLIRVFLWKVILGYNGVVNSALLWLGVIDEPLGWINYNANAVVLTLAHAYAPFAILPIFVALEKIDRSLLEAGQDLGETRFQTFLRVTLPLAVPGVVAAVLIVFIPTIGDYVTPRLIGGKDGTMIANLIQSQFLRQNNAPLGSALAVISMITVAAISLVFVFLNRKNMRGGQ
ncbi:ABC transporter permease [Frigidibacter sp. ROC022]|uniref:ABC transporter permease n=1 Tax=Frigidibacter sp. ROC022 TaxID=2971796 RepID=UPI00215A6931|nr:ABC transporter permease [Frigidibacter sp. ROC022]MCR8726436.1 ABC transporter permease [Frigidibacter sp. ROC022]